MNDKKDGGSAFPYVVNEHGVIHEYKGMSLRDYFAAGIVVPYEIALKVHKKNKGTIPTTKEIAELRAEIKYLEADAMLKERDK